jgi:hypothetical protein
MREGFSLKENDAAFRASDRSQMKHICCNEQNHYDKLIDQAVFGSK